jgi:hypothetical protein
MHNFWISIKRTFYEACKTALAQWPMLLAAGIFLFGAIWFGYIIRVIGSREMSAKLQIEILVDKQIKLTSQPYVQLSHAGNITTIGRDGGVLNRWYAGDAFISRIYFVLEKSELESIKGGVIILGQKTFNFNRSDLQNWQTDAQAISSHIKLKQNQFLALVPSNIRSTDSRLPFYSKVFGQTVNWAGDDKLISEPLIAAIKMFVLTIFAWFLYYLVILMALGEDRRELRTENELESRLNFLFFSLAIYFTIISLVILNLLIIIFYHPNIAKILEQAEQKFLPQMMASMVPKPVERLQFVLSVVFAPIMLWASYKLIKQKISKFSHKWMNYLYKLIVPMNMILLFALVFCGLAMSNFLYLQNSLLVTIWGKYLYTLLFFPLLLWLILQSETHFWLKRVLNSLPYVCMVIVVAAVFLLNIFNIKNIPGAFHFNPVFYPITQILGGKTLLVGFGSLYGLFPIFISPIIKLAGVSVLNFSLVMASLLALSYLALFVFLHSWVKNKFILTAGVFSLFVYAYFNSQINSSVYLQYWPIRFLPACILIFLAGLYIKSQKKSAYYYLSFIWCCFSLIWNLETGAVIALSWLLLLGYETFTAGFSKPAVKVLGKHLLVMLGLLLSAILLLVLYTYARSGSFPQFSYFIKYQQLFFSGYFMIPMLPPPHAWVAVLLTYLIGLMLGLVNWFKPADEKNKLIFFLAILGIGLFSYYEGRSHDVVLIEPAFVAVLLFIIFADDLLMQFKKNAYQFYNLPVLIFLLFFLFSAPLSLFVIAGKTLASIKSNLAAITAIDPAIKQNTQFIKQYTHQGEKIFIISQNYDGIYYGETGTVSAPNLPSSSDYFTQEEVNHIIKFLKQNVATKIFIDTQNPLKIDSGINSTLEQFYKIEKISQNGMELLIKK